MSRLTQNSAALASPLHIAHVRLVTGLGQDARTSAAAWVAQRRCFRNEVIDGKKLFTAPVTNVTQDLQGAPRLRALLDALLPPPSGAKPVPASGVPLNTQAMLLLPDWLLADDQQGLAQQVHERLQILLGAPLRLTYRATSGTLASHQALHDLMGQPANGAAPTRHLLIAVDSLCEPTVLKREHTQGRVRYAGAHDVPAAQAGTASEAAAMLMLQATPPAEVSAGPGGRGKAHGRAAGPPTVRAIHRPALGSPTSSPRWPSQQQGDGRNFSEPVARALAHAGLPLDDIGGLIDDNEDQAWRTEDRWLGLQRLSLATPDHPWEGRHLGGAEQLGQLGVATGAVHWAMLAALAHQGLGMANTVLSCTHDPNGACAATVLELRP